MARYQPQGGRGPQPREMLPPRRQLPPPEPPVRQRALTGLLLGVLSLIGLTLGLGNLRRGIFVAILTLIFAAAAIWLGVTATRKARRGGPGVDVDPVAVGVVSLVALARGQCWPGGTTPRNPPLLRGPIPPNPPWGA